MWFILRPRINSVPFHVKLKVSIIDNKVKILS